MLHIPFFFGPSLLNVLLYVPIIVTYLLSVVTLAA
jgi:hypothetical protein